MRPLHATHSYPVDMRRILLLLVALALIAVACDRASEATTTTAPDAVATTSTSVSATDTTPVSETVPATTTTVIAPSVIHLEYVVRFKGTTAGKNVVILQIDEGTATDIALESLARQAIDEFDPLSELYVVDSEDAIELVRLDPTSLTDEQKNILSQHYLIHVKEAVLTFQGPFRDLGEFVLGS